MYIGVPLFESWGIDEDHNITLTFNGHGESKLDYLNATVALAESCRWWYANGNRRIYGTFGPSEAFDGNCWHSKVTSPNMERFREKLVQELDREGVYHSEDYDFKPHVTLNYGREPVTNPYEGGALIVDRLAVVSRNFGRTEVRV